MLTSIQTAFIIKWVITALVILALVLFFVGGYFHAQRRMKKGLPPLRYHRVSVQHAASNQALGLTDNSGWYLDDNGNGSSHRRHEYTTITHRMVTVQAYLYRTTAHPHRPMANRIMCHPTRPRKVARRSTLIKAMHTTSSLDLRNQ